MSLFVASLCNHSGPDLEPALITLGKLGARHVEYGVLPAHYGIVGQALLHTLETALGDKWTPKVKGGWTTIYGMVSSAMMTGAERRLTKKQRLHERRQQRLQQIKSSPQSTEKPKIDDGSLAARRRTRGPKKSVITVLAQITGIIGLAKRTPDNSRQEQVSKLVEDALSVVSSSASITSSSTCPVSEPLLDPSSLDETIDCVYKSWDAVRAIPNYQEVAGVLLFQK
jgi:hypothetical protein